jgi:hypothetical protein
MNTKKLAIGATISVALCGAGGVATAAIPGVVGEAALVPAAFSGSPDGVNIHTYVGLFVPEVIGEDTVISKYSAPHAAPTTTTQSFDGTKAIHWTLFDKRSKKIEDGDCDASPGDIVLWSTDPAVRQMQLRQRRGLTQNAGGFLPPGVPDPVCGPTNTGWRAGYVVFQTRKGASREDANFAFSGYASIIEQGVLTTTQSIGSVPVMPMADGNDAAQPTVQLGNEVVQNPGALNVPSVPKQVAPILAGIRMNNADGNVDLVRIEAPIQGPAAGYGRSIHFFWFDSNLDSRTAYITGWDDHEQPCTNGKPMPDEMDIIIYNQYVDATGFPAGSGWENVKPEECTSSCSGGGKRTQLLTAIQPPLLGGYRSDEYCEPPYWLPEGDYPGAIAGNVTYEFVEEGEPATPGFVNSASVAFNWQESVLYGGVAWANHMSTDLGTINY